MLFSLIRTSCLAGSGLQWTSPLRCQSCHSAGGTPPFLFAVTVSSYFLLLILHLSGRLKLGSACKYAFYMLWGCLAFEFINIEWINTYCQNKALGRTSRRPAEVKYANILIKIAAKGWQYGFWETLDTKVNNNGCISVSCFTTFANMTS